MKNVDAIAHVTGKSIYLDDLPVLESSLFAMAFDAPVAHAKIRSIDYSAALNIEGVERIITHKDIPGVNQIGGIIADEPLLAIDEIHFWGMPILIILADSEYSCRKAYKAIDIDFEKLEVITDPREARAKDSLIFPPRTFEIGDVEKVFEDSVHVFSGRSDTNGQEHLYIETQGAYAYPMENGSIKIASSTQGPTAVQRTAAKVLGVAMHKIEVDVTRLGGGFGGKEDQATVWGVIVALSAFLSNRPVKYALHRMEDMRMTGKRHPYSSDYKIALDNEYKILAFEACFHQNAGAAADLSPAVMERTLFHGTNSYFVPNAKLTAYSCKTNLPPNTAFRGFGGPQGMFVIESAIRHAAESLGINPRVIQERNLLRDGDEFPYGQIVDNCEAGPSWNACCENFDIEKLEAEVESFNKNNQLVKKGIALMPVCFGISFTNTPMNNARALVHIYQDGSVGISTGGVEMGQGLNTKMVQIAMAEFSLAAEFIKLETTNTTRVANTSPSAASSTADLNGKALEIACRALKTRLLDVASDMLKVKQSELFFEDGQVLQIGKEKGLIWKELITAAHLKRVCLTENGHYSTPHIHFDKSIEKGHPFAYHVYGNSITVVNVDCIRGIYEVESVMIVHDFGKTMNTAIDYGQIEGGLVQGIGWMTLEDLQYNSEGRLLSNALSTYKIPDIYSVPKQIEIIEHKTDGHPLAIRKSKAVGEPPLMYGMGSYFAIQQAVKAFNPNYSLKFDAPFTPEKVLMALYENQSIELSELKGIQKAKQ